MSLWPPNRAVVYIEASALKEELANAGELALLDVREQGQYGEGHPFHAVNLAYSRLEFEARRLLPNPAVQIVLLDDGRGDTLALRAASRLQAMGYVNVRVLKDGTQGWRAAQATPCSRVCTFHQKPLGSWSRSNATRPGSPPRI